MGISVPFRAQTGTRSQPQRTHTLRFIIASLGLIVAGVLAGWMIWATIAWLRYSHVAATEPNDPIIAQFMPRYEVVERHERIVAATPAVVFRQVQAFSLDDSRIIRTIFKTREVLFRQKPSASSVSPPFLQLAKSIGWGVLDSVPGHEVVYGAITQPWRGDVHFRSLSPNRFAAFDSAGYAKIVWSIAVDSLARTTSRLRTETRVVTTDPQSRARFRRYWATYSPGIVLIRREALRLIGEAAEKESNGP